MPTYEYKCPGGHVFEKIFPKMTDRRHERCPQCGKRATRVISGGVGLVFKGSGFYVTDYKRAGEKKGEGEAKPAAESKTESKTESKPDTGNKKDSKDK